MKRTKTRILLLFLVAALAALTFAGTASAGWTWTGVNWATDEAGTPNGWTWDDAADGWTWDEASASPAAP
jgi:hypothetical protein